MNSPAEVCTGQVWKENDPRQERYVRVLYVTATGKFVRIKKCNPDGSEISGARESEALKHRFNGNRGGYALVKDAS